MGLDERPSNATRAIARLVEGGQRRGGGESGEEEGSEMHLGLCVPIQTRGIKRHFYT